MTDADLWNAWLMWLGVAVVVVLIAAGADPTLLTTAPATSSSDDGSGTGMNVRPTGLVSPEMKVALIGAPPEVALYSATELLEGMDTNKWLLLSNANATGWVMPVMNVALMGAPDVASNSPTRPPPKLATNK